MRYGCIFDKVITLIYSLLLPTTKYIEYVQLSTPNSIRSFDLIVFLINVSKSLKDLEKRREKNIEETN